MLQRLHPDTVASWEDDFRSWVPVVHAELRVLIFIGPPPPSCAGDAKPSTHFIGASAPTCECCWDWIGAFNAKFGTSWYTTGTFCNPDYDFTWLLPSVAWRGAASDFDLCSVDAAALKSLEFMTQAVYTVVKAQ